MGNEFFGRSISIVLVIFAAIISAGCNDLEVQSKWKSQDIVIDGKNTDWKGGIYIKDANASLSVCNDEGNLYLCLISSDRDLPRKIMGAGLNIWFKSNIDGSKLGIRFPIGMMDADRPQFVEKEMPEGERPDPKKMEEKMFGGQDEYEILNKDNKVEGRFPFDEKSGIMARVGQFQGRFVYEMKVPISKDKRLANSLLADTSSVINIEVETGQMSFPDMREKKGGDGGMRGGDHMTGQEGMPSDGGGQMRGGMPPMHGSQSDKQLKMSINVKLSSKDI